MFLRSIKAPNGRHEYLRLVESYREGDKVKQRIVAHLGRKDLLAPHIDTLIRLLQEESSFPRWVPLEQISTPRASTWGPILVARHLFDKLSLGRFGCGPGAAAPRSTVVGKNFSFAGESLEPSGQRARPGAMAGRFLCVHSRGPPLGSGLETVPPCEGGLRSVEALVSKPG